MLACIFIDIQILGNQNSVLIEMSKKQYTKIVHEGNYVAQVDVELIYTDEEWSPNLSMEDVYKLDDVRKTQKSGKKLI